MTLISVESSIDTIDAIVRYAMAREARAPGLGLRRGIASIEAIIAQADTHPQEVIDYAKGILDSLRHVNAPEPDDLLISIMEELEAIVTQARRDEEQFPGRGFEPAFAKLAALQCQIESQGGDERTPPSICKTLAAGLEHVHDTRRRLEEIDALYSIRKSWR